MMKIKTVAKFMAGALALVVLAGIVPGPQKDAEAASEYEWPKAQATMMLHNVLYVYEFRTSTGHLCVATGAPGNSRSSLDCNWNSKD